MGTCAHAFCKACLDGYFRGKVKERTAPIYCCEPECKEIIDSGLVLQISGEHISLSYRQDLAEAAMANKVYCPYAGCGLAHDIKEGTKKATCLACNQLFCAACRVPWHRGVTCRQFSCLPEEQRSPEDAALFQAIKKNCWRRCPGCGHVISKQEDFCNWMSCKCGCKFCFRCSEKYIDDQPTAENVHGRAGCGCPLFDFVEEEIDGEGQQAAAEEMSSSDEADEEPLLAGGQHVPAPPQDRGLNIPPRAKLVEAKQVGLVKVGNARMRRRQYVDLVGCKERGNLLPEWLHTLLERNQCFYCARSFDTLAQLNSHLQNTRQHAVYACCGRIFTDLNGLTNHAECHRKKK